MSDLHLSALLPASGDSTHSVLPSEMPSSALYTPDSVPRVPDQEFVQRKQVEHDGKPAIRVRRVGPHHMRETLSSQDKSFQRDHSIKKIKNPDGSVSVITKTQVVKRNIPEMQDSLPALPSLSSLPTPSPPASSPESTRSLPIRSVCRLARPHRPERIRSSLDHIRDSIDDLVSPRRTLREALKESLRRSLTRVAPESSHPPTNSLVADRVISRCRSSQPPIDPALQQQFECPIHSRSLHLIRPFDDRICTCRKNTCIVS